MLQAVVRAGGGRRLVAVGERGLAIHSDDDGQSWAQAEVPVGCTLTALRFADERRGWATGNLGVVLGGALGLAVADFETIQAWEEWRGTQGKDVRTYMERSGRGFHVFFRGPGLVNAAIRLSKRWDHVF